VSKIKVQVLKYLYERGKRLMIIKWRKYNGVGELLIGIDNHGLWGQLCYGTGPEGSVTMVAVCEGRRNGGNDMTWGAYSQSLGREG